MKYVAFICFYITMNVICYGGYSMSTILFFIFIDFIFYLLVQWQQCANPATINTYAIPLFAPQSLFYIYYNIILTSINIDFNRESLQLFIFCVKKSENQEKISLTLYLFLACPLAGWPEQML